MKLRDLISNLECECVGSLETEVYSIKFAKDATEDDVAIAYSENDVMNTRAKVILLNPCVVKTHKTLLYTFESVDQMAIKLAKKMIQTGCLKDYSRNKYSKLRSNGYCTGNNISIGENTEIGMFTVIGDDVTIGSNTWIDSNVWIGSDVHIGDNVIIHSGAKIGADALFKYTENDRKTFAGIGTANIMDYVEIGYNTIIQRGTFSDTIIGHNSIIGNLVDIGHDVKIGEFCDIVSQTGIAGRVNIGKNVIVFGQVGIINDVSIGDDVTIMSKSRVTKNISSGKKISGMYGNEHEEELRIQAKIRQMGR